MVKKLTDENGDLSQDMALLHARLRRYEKDLDAAKKVKKLAKCCYHLKIKRGHYFYEKK